LSSVSANRSSSQVLHLTALEPPDPWEWQGGTAASPAWISGKRVTISGEICDLCTNLQINIAELDNAKVAGFLCGRDYDSTGYVKRDTGAIDLLGERRKVSTFRPQAGEGENIVIGLPAAVHMVEDLPLWRKFFDLLGIRTVSSERYSDGLKAGKSISRAEFCAPIATMHGHAAGC
jgi:hypothetical protein